MNTKILILVGVVIVIVGSVIIVFNSPSNKPISPEVIMEKDQTTQPITNNNILTTDNEESRYITYSPTAYEAARNKKRVLLFHAVWCPTCKAANQEFTSLPDKIPPDIILLKTDYDTETELKKKYNITYQHTFVQVDEQGNEITKWNGGGIQELVDNVR